MSTKWDQAKITTLTIGTELLLLALAKVCGYTVNGNTLRHSWVHAAGDSGNVFSYNYSLGNIESDSGTGWLAEDDAHHVAESFMNLHEGNVVSNVTCDMTHGGDAFNVFLGKIRSYLVLVPPMLIAILLASICISTATTTT